MKELNDKNNLKITKMQKILLTTLVICFTINMATGQSNAHFTMGKQLRQGFQLSKGIVGMDDAGIYVCLSEQYLPPASLSIDYFNKDLTSVKRMNFKDIELLDDRKRRAPSSSRKKQLFEFFIQNKKKELFVAYSSFDKKERKGKLSLAKLDKTQGKLIDVKTILNYPVKDNKKNLSNYFFCTTSPDSSKISFYAFKENKKTSKITYYFEVFDANFNALYTKLKEVPYEKMIETGLFNPEEIIVKLDNNGNIYWLMKQYNSQYIEKY